MVMGIITAMIKRVLFICGKGRQRSPTAEQIFSQREGWETDSAGLSADADIVVSSEQIDWATYIVVMEKRQLARLKKAFPKLVSGKKIICLDVPDNFEFMQPELIDLLQSRIARVGA
jgi:predicted protein tyrosine phosphatase